jgi:hypothetical protein
MDSTILRCRSWRSQLGFHVVSVSVAATVGYAGLAFYRASRASEASAV